ncbi:hypothetical protein RchiOBHm_Chr5g0077711 [Rosa chinensis]|uniref:Uncharacterized protein n=1 Tax=Rosa chinensis TaxID=74649 RepID=A0A2P6QM09_ROSCH|nr:hypothetical protein RchiOBHm_Chr5g0077711 [Rosa chinensis]
MQKPIIQLCDFLSGVEAFEHGTKFCYGITITLSAHNIVAASSSAEFLELGVRLVITNSPTFFSLLVVCYRLYLSNMCEVEKGNLIYKL